VADMNTMPNVTSGHVMAWKIYSSQADGSPFSDYTFT